MTVLVVKCPQCGKEREIKPGEIPEGDFPMCPDDGMPMMPKEARSGE